MRFFEFQLPKNTWEFVVSNSDKEEVGHELIDLVKTAYSTTPKGSLVNSLKDVIPSDWNVIDWDQDPDIDSCVFYRHNRPNETWVGYKIQGIGHDGTRPGKDYAIRKVQELLQKNGIWIESSDALRHVLMKLNTTPITDEKFLQRLFNDDQLRMIDKDTYQRKLTDGTVIEETVFGRPVLRGQK